MESIAIGNQIAKARKKINLSQAELAKQLFISPQAVGKWERGESIPDMVTCNKLAGILGVDLNYFSENFPSDTRASTPASTADTSENPVQTEEEEGQQLLTDFSGSNLSEGDFAGITAHKRKFSGSALRGSNFSDADLTGSSFTGSNMQEVHFHCTNLTDCTFSALDLKNASFHKTILVRTAFSASDLTGAKFLDAKLNHVKLTQMDLRKTIFERCEFHGVHFKQSDLRGLCLDGQSFTGVRFDRTVLNKATFKGAILKNVSFFPTFALTNKYYRAIQTINFNGAMMDKLTYASLKGFGADLSNVTII